MSALELCLFEIDDRIDGLKPPLIRHRKKRKEPMDLRQLRYFTTIAERGSFSEAASHARIAQSALSRHVIQLEKELGVKLFERHARGVDLTESGTMLLERARDILQQVGQMQSEIVSRADSPSGEVMIGTTSTTSRLLYGPLAEQVEAQFPQIRLRFIEGVPHLLLEGLDTGSIDLAVMVDPEPRPSLAMDTLVSEQVYLIAAPGKPGLPQGPCRVGALKDLPLILLPRPAGSRVSLDRLSSQAGIALDVRHEVASVDVVKDFVVRGLGFGVLPHSSVMAGVADGQLDAVPMEEIVITRTLVRRADRAPSPAVTELMRLVRGEFDRMITAGAFGGAARKDG